jgi:hypothetical protein
LSRLSREVARARFSSCRQELVLKHQAGSKNAVDKIK